MLGVGGGGNYVAFVPAVIASLPLLRVYVAGLPFISLWRWLRSLCFLMFLCFVFYYFSCNFIHVLFTALYLLRYSYVGILTRRVTWVPVGLFLAPLSKTVTCWLVATTACSCGFRTIDIVWFGPVFLVPGFLRRPNPCGFGEFPPRPGLVQSCVLVPDVFS